jgi:hypothetical protein
MEGGNFCFVRFLKKTTSFSFLFSPSGSEQQTITFAPVQVPLCGSEPKCFFISPFFGGRRIYFYEAISKLKRSYKSQKRRRRRNGEEEGRSVMMREGGAPYCTSDLRPSKNGTHVNIWMGKKDTIHLEHVNSTRHRKKTKSKGNPIKIDDPTHQKKYKKIHNLKETGKSDKRIDTGES